MNDLFWFLTLIFFGCFLLSIISPSIFRFIFKEKTSRKSVWSLFLITTFLSFVLFGFTLPNDKKNPEILEIDSRLTEKEGKDVLIEDNNQVEEIMIEKTEKEKVEELVKNILKENNNLDEHYEKDIKIIKFDDSGIDVIIEFNADDNFTANLQKKWIESKMSEIYTVLYTSEYNVNSVVIMAFFPVTDKYGNDQEIIVYQSSLNKEEADKVNWNADNNLLKWDILPNVWTKSKLHNDFL